MGGFLVAVEVDRDTGLLRCVHNIEDSVEGQHNAGECETNQGPIISAVSTLLTLSIRTGDNNTDIQQLFAQIFPHPTT